MVCKKLNQGIAEYLRTHGFANVAQLVGSLRTGGEIENCAISG
jgi:dihydroorotate dehydrogenase